MASNPRTCLQRKIGLSPAYISAGAVTLTDAASTTVSGADTTWGTDDTVSVQAASDIAALTVGDSIGATVFYPKGKYIISALTLNTFVSHKGEIKSFLR